MTRLPASRSTNSYSRAGYHGPLHTLLNRTHLHTLRQQIHEHSLEQITLIQEHTHARGSHPPHVVTCLTMHIRQTRPCLVAYKITGLPSPVSRFTTRFSASHTAPLSHSFCPRLTSTHITQADRTQLSFYPLPDILYLSPRYLAGYARMQPNAHTTQTHLRSVAHTHSHAALTRRALARMKSGAVLHSVCTRRRLSSHSTRVYCYSCHMSSPALPLSHTQPRASCIITQTAPRLSHLGPAEVCPIHHEGARLGHLVDSLPFERAIISDTPKRIRQQLHSVPTSRCTRHARHAVHPLTRARRNCLVFHDRDPRGHERGHSLQILERGAHLLSFEC